MLAAVETLILIQVSKCPCPNPGELDDSLVRDHP